MKGYALPKSIKPSGPAVWLQGLGWCEAKPAKDLVVGDKILFNYGYKGEIVSVRNYYNRRVYITIAGESNERLKWPNTLVPFEAAQEVIDEQVRQNLIKGAL